AGRWRWVALSLRLLAVLLCVLAALRPSVFLKEKKKQNASVVVLLDSSSSMKIGDEVGGKTRWEVAQTAVKEARDFGKTLGPDLDFRFYHFDSKLTADGAKGAKPPDAPQEKQSEKEREPSQPAQPEGRETNLGSALVDAQKQQESTGRRLARVVVLSD